MRLPKAWPHNSTGLVTALVHDGGLWGGWGAKWWPTSWSPKERCLEEAQLAPGQWLWSGLGCHEAGCLLSPQIVLLEDIPIAALGDQSQCPCLLRLQWGCEASPAQWTWGRAPLCGSRHSEPPGSDRRQHLLSAGCHHGPALRKRRGGGRIPQETVDFQGETGRRPVWGGELICGMRPPPQSLLRWSK